MKIDKIQHSESGVVLIVVLSIMIILGVLAMNILYGVRMGFKRVKVDISTVRAYNLTRAGLAKAIVLLRNDSDYDVDTLTDPWAVEVTEGRTYPSGENGTFTISITDEASKFNINLLYQNPSFQPILKRILMGMGIEYGEASIKAEEITDWISKDEEITLVYHKNKPLNTVGELIRIPTVTKELFYGNDDLLGLLDLVTIYTSGEININTANKIILAATLNITPDEALRLTEYRDKVGGFKSMDELIAFMEKEKIPLEQGLIGSGSWYSYSTEWEEIYPQQSAGDEFGDWGREYPSLQIAYSSRIFKIKSTATIYDSHTKPEINAIVDRGKGEFGIFDIKYLREGQHH